jgi:hypothetical protein
MNGTSGSSASEVQLYARLRLAARDVASRSFRPPQPLLDATYASQRPSRVPHSRRMNFCMPSSPFRV